MGGYSVATPLPEAGRAAQPATDVHFETPSFESIYENHVDFVWRSVRRLGTPECYVDDAVQDVFVVVHRRLSDYRADSSLRSWLFGIARRVAKDHRRRSKRKDRQGVPSDELADARQPSPYDHAANSQARELLYTLLEQLDDDKREVFVLAELEQMRVPEIASALSINLNTVYSRLRNARQIFNRAVERHFARTGDNP